MYTEAELRDALQHSAARVDDLIAAAVDGHVSSHAIQPGDLALSAHIFAAAGRHRRWRAASAAAIGVAAIGVGTFVAIGIGSSDSPSAGPPPAASTAAASHVLQPPARGGATSRPSSAKIALNNLITLGGRTSTDYSFGPIGKAQIIMVGGKNAVNVIALPASAPFDPATQIHSAQRVQVAGTTGYYGAVAAGVSGASMKYGPSKATLAWQAPNGTWLFIQGMNEGVNLPAATLVSRAQELNVVAAPAPLPRIPFRVGWLPAGLTVTSVEAQPGAAGTVVGLTSGSNTVTINVAAGTVGAEAGRLDGTSDDTSAQRSVGNVAITIHAHGYTQSDTQKILNNLDLSKLPGAPSTWWSLTEAFND